MQDRSLHPNTRILVDAWRRMGRTPSTNTVDDPRVAEHPDLITQLFVVQHSREYGWLFRTAGQGLSGLLGRDLTNHDFLQLWSGPDREMMAHFMEAVRFDGAPGIIRGRGETLTGQRVEVEITLMPLVRPGCSASTRRSAVNPCSRAALSGATAFPCSCHRTPVPKVRNCAL